MGHVAPIPSHPLAIAPPAHLKLVGPDRPLSCIVVIRIVLGPVQATGSAAQPGTHTHICITVSVLLSPHLYRAERRPPKHYCTGRWLVAGGTHTRALCMRTSCCACMHHVLCAATKCAAFSVGRAEPCTHKTCSPCITSAHACTCWGCAFGPIRGVVESLT